MTYIIDLHEDIAHHYVHGGSGFKFSLEDFDANTIGRHADIPKYIAGNVKLVFGAIFPGALTYRPEESERYMKVYGVRLPAFTFRTYHAMFIEQLNIYRRIVRRFSNNLKIVKSYNDLTEIFKHENKVGILLHLEGADLIWDVDEIDLIYDLGVRSIGITWNFDNKYGASCLTKKDYGLTTLGEELVKRANEVGMIIDVAHGSKKLMIDVLNVSKKPVIISHANLKAIVDNPRNVDDEVLEKLVENKGVIGITLISPLLKKENVAMIEDVVKHIMGIYERYGPEVIAIGTDFFGTPFMPEVKDLESIDKLVKLAVALREKGLRDSDVEKIFYSNAMRVLRENLI